MIRTIFLYSYVVVLLILSLPILLVEWIIGKFNPHAKDVSCLWIARTLVLNPVLFFMGAKITAYGVENIPSDRPVVYMANHRGMMDCLLLYKYFKGVCGFVAKAEVKKIPLVNLWMNNLHCLYVDRDDIRDGLKMILAGIEKLKSGISICIMPEGTRSKTDELLPFKEGSMKLATKTGCPIIPVAITGSADLFDNHKPFFGPAKITMTFGKPLEVKDLSRDQQKNLGAHVREIICEMLEKGPGYIPEEYDFTFSKTGK